MKLDLAAGQFPREGFESVDITPGIAQHCVDLVSGEPWPWEDNSVEELHCSHFIEHIRADYLPNGQDALLFFFDEAYRIAKPDAQFTLVWPALKSSNAFRDPTHRRFIPLEFTHYLSRIGRKTMRVDHYQAACDWEVVGVNLHVQQQGYTMDQVNQSWDIQDSYTVLLRARKDSDD